MHRAAMDFPLNPNDKHTQQEAITFIKKHERALIAQFASLDDFPREDVAPVSIFMAGSPGAGKTEISKRLIESFQQKPVRIDADEIRGIIPQYTGTNSDVVQAAASLGVEKLYDIALKQRQNLILDGTLARSDKARSNIARSLKRGRSVQVFFVYQNPLTAWEVTKKREAIEGRRVPKEFFIRSYFASQASANTLKEEFGDDIQLHVVVRDAKTGLDKLDLNVTTVDPYLRVHYTSEQLERKLS